MRDVTSMINSDHTDYRALNVCRLHLQRLKVPHRVPAHDCTTPSIAHGVFSDLHTS